MRWIWMAIALLLAGPVAAKPANTECVVSDGTRAYIVASKGDVMIQWENGEWREAFAKVEGQIITVIQIATDGIVVLSWNYRDNRAYVIVENSKTGKKIEKPARCWFK